MSQQRNSPVTLTAGEDLIAFRRVKISGSTVVYADALDHGIGVVQVAVDYSEDASSCIRLDVEGTCKMMASGVIAAGGDAYAATDGKVAGSGTVEIGVALEASTANGDIIEVLPKFDTAYTYSDIQVNASDIVTNSSDIVVIKSDLVAAKSDITILESDSTTVQSDIVVIKSDVIANRSNLVTGLSDAVLAVAAGDLANASDILVTLTEMLAAIQAKV